MREGKSNLYQSHTKHKYFKTVFRRLILTIFIPLYLTWSLFNPIHPSNCMSNFQELKFIILVDMHLISLYPSLLLMWSTHHLSCFYGLPSGYIMKPLILFSSELFFTLHRPNTDTHFGMFWNTWHLIYRFDKQSVFPVEKFFSLIFYYGNLQKYNKDQGVL